MLNSVTHIQPNQTRPRFTAQATPSPTIPPSPGPRDSVDLSSIDAPEKAIMLPALNAPILSLLYGALSFNSTLVSASINYQLGLSATPGNISYLANTPDGKFLKASGTLAGQPFSETWTPSADGGYDVQGQIGASSEKLHVRTDNQFWYLDGTAGNVSVHEKGWVVLGPGDGDARYILDGSLNDKVLHNEIYKSYDSSTLVTYGYLGEVGGANQFTSVRSADGTQVTISGAGKVCGVEFNVDATVQVEPPPATHTPAPR